MKKTLLVLMGLMLGLGNLQAAKLVTDNLPGLPGQSDAYWAERRQEQAKQSSGQQGQFVNLREVAAKQELVVNRKDEPVCFYTGKPFDVELGTYVFKYRNYNPDMQRWTTMDPSGFPDGANNYCYVLSPMQQLDPNGCWTFDVSNEVKTKIDPVVTGLIKGLGNSVQTIAEGYIGTSVCRVEWSITNFDVNVTVVGSAHGELVVTGGLVSGDAVASYSLPPNLSPDKSSGTVGSGGSYYGILTNKTNINSSGDFAFSFDPAIRITDAILWFDIDVTRASGTYSAKAALSFKLVFYE
jgi:RHS repeat-associated protein